jgi:molybdopterin converting factor small subunit
VPTVFIPTALQPLTGGQAVVQVPGATVRQVINSLERQFPGVKELLYDPEEDALLAGLAVTIDGEVGQLGLLEQLREDSELHFLPAIAGGWKVGESDPHPDLPPW